MGYTLCNAESAIATCDSCNYKPILTRKKRLNKQHQPPQLNLRRFTYADLEAATNHFSPLHLLGKGSHGAVYRAVLDNGSRIVAVKRPTSSATLAAQNEIDILSNISSRRVVNLIGYVPDPVLLVVEYMPKGSLYDLIHKQKKPPIWSTRLRIALQVGKAVRTLHASDPPVIHRDIKSSNVLLDRKFGARLSDFGLALSGRVEDVRVMSTPPAGTLGYLDPCYLAPGDVSAKSDVFSFGILLLEIISGRRAIDVNYSPPAIIEWAVPLVKARDYQAVFDRRIGWFPDRTVVKELSMLAARCVRSTADKRPSMTEVVECLKTVYKRVKLMKTVPLWSNLRRRVGRVEKCQPLDETEKDGSDWEEHKAREKASRHGSRKVSSVPNLEDRVDDVAVTRVVHRTGKLKSKSMGSFREIKVGPGIGNCEIITTVDNNNNNNNNNGSQLAKMRSQMRVKKSNVGRLSKSRSMSVLQMSSENVNYHGNNYLVRKPQVKELDVFPLLVKCSSSSKSASTAL